MDHGCMCCGSQFISLLFLRLLSEICQTSMNARFVFSHLCWLLNKGYQAARPCSHIILCLAFLGQIKQQWIRNTSVTTERTYVFLHHFVASHYPHPTMVNHPNVINCGTGEKIFQDGVQSS